LLDAVPKDSERRIFMKNAFIFETENESPYQDEYSYEDFESDYEDFEDLEDEGYEMADEIRGRVRDHRRAVSPVARPNAYRPFRAVTPFRGVRRVPYGFRPGAYRHRYRPGAYRFGYRPYRWRPGFRRYGYGYGAAYQPGMGSIAQPGFGSGAPADGLASPLQPSMIVMLLQRLLNRTMGTNLPVDGVMSVETRNALRDFQSQPAEPPSPPPGATTPPGPEGGAPQSEYDELAYLESEFDEFGY
jgi:hypothetical protein